MRSRLPHLWATFLLVNARELPDRLIVLDVYKMKCSYNMQTFLATHLLELT